VVSQSVSAPCGAHDQIFITLWNIESCFCGTSSLAGGRVCLLHLRLVLASVVFLRSESLGTRDLILLSQVWDFPFRRLLRFAGSRWRYSTPLPHGCTLESKLCYDWRSVAKFVLVSSTHLGLTTRFLFLSDSCGVVDVGRFLWWENGSVVYNCRWSSPAQWVLGPIPTGFFIIFYCHRPRPGGPGARIYIPQEQGGPVIPPGTRFLFRRLLRLAGLRYSNSPSRGVHSWMHEWTHFFICDRSE
jgi:hypothetical protein